MRQSGTRERSRRMCGLWELTGRRWSGVPSDENLLAGAQSSRCRLRRIVVRHLWRKAGVHLTCRRVGVDSSQFLTEASGRATHACQERAASRERVFADVNRSTHCAGHRSVRQKRLARIDQTWSSVVWGRSDGDVGTGLHQALFLLRDGTKALESACLSVAGSE